MLLITFSLKSFYLFHKIFSVSRVQIKPVKILWIYAFLLVGIAYVCGLFIDLTGDSGLYAAISRQIVESGNWMNLKINGVPYDQKPQLFFWLAGLGIQLFGNTNFAFKLFPFIWALAGIYFTWHLGKLLYSAEAGKWAALIMATAQMTFLYFFDFHTDTVLYSGVTLALWQLAAYLKNNKSVHFILGFFGVGLAMLTKGPIGAVLPFFAVLYYFFMKKDYKSLFHYKWILGVFIVLIVISPALIHLYRNFGWEGIRFYFITNNFGRISGEYAGSSTDPFFYVHTFFWAFLPWTVFAVAAVISSFKKGFDMFRPDAWTAYLLGSALVLLVILSLAKGKAPNYFFIALPLFSVLTGDWLSQKIGIPGKTKQSILVLQWFVVGLIMLIFGMAVYINTGNNNWLPVVLGIMLLLAAGFTFRFQKDKLKRVILISFILTGTVNLFLNASVILHLYSYQGARQALKIYEQQRQKNDKLYNFELEEYELFFMANDSVRQIKDWNELYKVMERPGTWVYTNEVKYNDIIQMDYNIDTVYQIQCRGMNRLSLPFLNPETRKSALKSNYLIRTR